jgi:tRNA pseudouridine38-40 synthase
MTEAAPVFLGEHDFSAFAAFRHDGTDAAPESGRNIRHVWRFDVTVEGPYVTIDIEGKGFLYKMVRLMVGALVHVGRGSLDGAGLRALFEARLDKTGRLIKSPLCAGAEGLTMVEVFYEPRGGDKV